MEYFNGSGNISTFEDSRKVENKPWHPNRSALDDKPH